jgi:hypothetical protein
MRLVDSKLIPLRLLIPIGPGIHEWSRTYRDLIFEMASFMDRSGGEVTPEEVRKFIGRRPRNDVVASFYESEIGMLMRKSVEYNLPVHRSSRLRANSQAIRFQVEKAPLRSEQPGRENPEAGVGGHPDM